MVFNAAHGNGDRLVPSGIGVVIIISRKFGQPSLRGGIRRHFLGQPNRSLSFYAIEAAILESDAARKERKARVIVALPRTGLDRGGPPPRMLPHST